MLFVCVKFFRKKKIKKFEIIPDNLIHYTILPFPPQSWDLWMVVKENPDRKKISIHYLKILRIRSFSGPYFSAFLLNTERYSVSPLIQTKCWKIRTRIIPNTDTFYAVIEKYISNESFWFLGYMSRLKN